MKLSNRYKNLLINFLKYFILFFLRFYFIFVRVREANRFSSSEFGSVCFYHQNILMLLKIAGKYKKLKKVTMLSKHKDADILAFILEKFGFKVFRTDSLHFNPAVFKKLLSITDSKYIPVMVLDGPIGPHKKINYGSLFLSKKFQLPINVILIKCDKYWQLSSWDKHIIPKPLTTIHSKIVTYKTIPQDYKLSRKSLMELKTFIDQEEAEFSK